MIYVVGVPRSRTPVVISRHRVEARALDSAERALAEMPTVTGLGLYIHEAEGERDARDLARIRLWADDQAYGAAR